MVSWDPAASATERTFSSPPSSMASAYWCPIGFELSPFIMRRPSPSPGPFHDLGINRFGDGKQACRSEEHTSELQPLMRISYAVFCLKKKNNTNKTNSSQRQHQTPQ